MPGLADDAVWRKRVEDIEAGFEEVSIPQASDVDQDSEWCEVIVNGEKQRLRFHDYGDVFSVPGLYEEVFYEKLQCCSPSYLVNLLTDVVRENGGNPSDFRVLDVGAGNGMVGDELHHAGIDSVIGVDLIPEARESTRRDRPGVYEDYRVCTRTTG